MTMPGNSPGWSRNLFHGTKVKVAGGRHDKPLVFQVARQYALFARQRIGWRQHRDQFVFAERRQSQGLCVVPQQASELCRFRDERCARS